MEELRVGRSGRWLALGQGISELQAIHSLQRKNQPN
jgi:hypothetical protein